MRSEAELEGVTLLGNNKTQYKTTYSPEVLEKFPNKHPGNDYMVTFNCPEFTSLCSRTLPKSRSTTFRTSIWWNPSRSSFTCSRSAITGISTKTA